MFAGGKSERLPLTIPLLPPAEEAKDYRLADGVMAPVYQHATSKTDIRLGEGNADGAVSPGESFAVLLKDGEAYRAAELFTNDPCVDLSLRISDDWSNYDHVGASA